MKNVSSSCLITTTDRAMQSSSKTFQSAKIGKLCVKDRGKNKHENETTKKADAKTMSSTVKIVLFGNDLSVAYWHDRYFYIPFVPSFPFSVLKQVMVSFVS